MEIRFRFLSAVILGALGMGLSGCTNMLYTGLKAPGSALGASSSNFGAGTLAASDGVCGGMDPNVLPSFNPFPGTTFGEYQVCPRGTSPADVTIGVLTQSTTAICVFPIAYSTSSSVPYIPNPTQAGLPLFQCMKVVDGVAFASFPGVSYNGVFIIQNRYDSDRQMSYLEEMVGCLQANNPMTCPFYSQTQEPF